jgi:tetratricopeptide (TPR) repeat protein/KaiC/GvpD/RAD55 family RecA-like ATPase
LASLERDRVPLPRPVSTKEVPLVDRTEEMKVLRMAVDRAIKGEGGLVFAYGEAGIGKTRLLRELSAYAQSRGVQVLHGRCPGLFRMDGVPPYVIWKEVIKDYLETCIPEQLYRVIGYYPAEVTKLVPELSQKLRTMPPSFPISPEQEQNRLFEAVSQFITNLSREAPLLLVLDDLQWTDASSLLLLHYLARGVQKTPLLLLGAYRSTDVDAKHPLAPILAELNRERLPQSVSLKRMSPNDISEMIKNILEQEDIPPEFCKTIYEKTRGNPFFAEEVIKSLKEEEVIYRQDNKWKIKEVSGIEFPETVKSVVTARISRLDEQCQNVLTLASFVGNDFTFDVLAGITGIEESKLQEIMDKLLRTGLIKHRAAGGEDLCSFADIIVRDVEYEEVGTFKRKKLHGLVASTLERIYANKIDEHLGELAYHFLEGGDKEKAQGYFMKAGEKAEKIYANSEAASYYRSALGLLEEKENELHDRALVLERLGEIEKLGGDLDACTKHWDEALLVSTKLQERQKTAALHRKIANVLWDELGDTKKAKEHQEAALKILEAKPESVELARLYEDIAHMLRRKGEAAKAPTWAEKALALAEKLNAAEAVAIANLELSAECIVLGNMKEAREYADKALRIALDNNYSETALRAYAQVVLQWGECEKCIEYHEKGLALAKKVGDIRWQSEFLSGLVMRNACIGELGKAVTLREEVLDLRRKGGQLTFIPMDLLALGSAYLMLGEWEKSEQYLNEAAIAAKGQDEIVVNVDSLGRFGQLHFEKGEYGKARERFEEAVKLWEKNTGGRTNYFWSGLLAWTYIELNEFEKAENLLDSQEKLVLEIAGKRQYIHWKPLRAMLLRAEKKYGESIELFEETRKEWESINANVWCAYWFARWPLSEYARAYLERDEEGDREKALSLLNRALEMFQRMGAKKDIEKVEARIALIETGQVVPKPKPIKHVSTGYVDLDKLLYGGIPSECAVVLMSPSCSERDLLVKSFLEIGAKNGEVTFFVTIDPSAGKTLAEEFHSNFYLFVCNPEADAIIKDSPNVFKLKGVENLTDISIALTTAIRKLGPSLKGPRRICISLVSDVLLYHHAVETRRWLTALMTKLKSEGFTTLAVMDPGIHSPEEVRAVSGLFEGEISILEKETEKGSERCLKIKRMSNQKYLEDELPLKRENLK